METPRQSSASGPFTTVGLGDFEDLVACYAGLVYYYSWGL